MARHDFVNFEDQFSCRVATTKMTCDDVKLLLADYWSQTLDEAQELAFEAHTASCERCRAEAERLGGLWKSLALLPGSSEE